MSGDPTKPSVIIPLLNLLPGMPAADVCGPDGCAPGGGGREDGPSR